MSFRTLEKCEEIVSGEPKKPDQRTDGRTDEMEFLPDLKEPSFSANIFSIYTKVNLYVCLFILSIYVVGFIKVALNVSV